VIFLVGNKCDLEAQRDVTYEEARQFAEENNLMYCEASAKTGQSVEVKDEPDVSLKFMSQIQMNDLGGLHRDRYKNLSKYTGRYF